MQNSRYKFVPFMGVVEDGSGGSADDPMNVDVYYATGEGTKVKAAWA